MNYFDDERFVEALKILWSYMKLNQKITKSNVIIGCGCHDLNIPVRCAELYREGFAKKILFTGGLGKITLNFFQKSEAKTFRDIAIKCGVDKNDILIENKSTNTGDNFRFGIKVLEKANITADKIIIVHRPINERRTFASAKAIILNKDISITSSKQSFQEFLDYVRQLIEEGEYPKGSDLEETALSVCLSVSQSSTPFKTTSTNYIPQARAGQLVLYTPIKKTLEPSPYLPIEDELILKKVDKERVKGILRAIKKFIDTVIDAAIELVDAVF